MESGVPLKELQGWGSIRDVVNAPLIDVAPDAWYMSVVGFYLTLLITIFMVLPSLCIPCVFVTVAIGCCNCDCAILFSVLGSVRWGRPLWLAPNTWRGWMSVLFAFIKNKGTRLLLFIWEWETFGKGQYWWHGEGVWCWSNPDCVKILQGTQMRKNAFGCVRAPVPDIFPSNILVFLPNTGPDSEWKAIRSAMHQFLFSNFGTRLPQLKERMASEWSNPQVMYILQFAGVNGTVAALTTSGAFIQAKKPAESAADLIDFSKYPTREDMIAVYKQNPENYIKEACRLDPPVTSATTSLAADQVVGLAGRQAPMEAGTLNQYVISMANRDENFFAEPSLFFPGRSDLDLAVTWNGRFGGDQTPEQAEEAYPRICPGRNLSISIVRMIVDRAIGS